MTIKQEVDWTVFEDALGKEALESLRDTEWYEAAIHLGRQGVEPAAVYDRYLQAHPTRVPTARIIAQAVGYVGRGGK